jgi:outer membrane murein-binding lipoprotein Lpp
MVGFLSAKVGLLSAKVALLSAKVGFLSAKVALLSAKVALLSAKVGFLSAKVGLLSAEVGFLSASAFNIQINVQIRSLHGPQHSSVTDGGSSAMSTFLTLLNKWLKKLKSTSKNRIPIHSHPFPSLPIM